MTNTTENYLYVLQGDLGFEPEYMDRPWFVHESEPVRFAWTDEEALSFGLYRFEGSVGSGLLVAKVEGSSLGLYEFRAVVRGFLHG